MALVAALPANGPAAVTDEPTPSDLPGPAPEASDTTDHPVAPPPDPPPVAPPPVAPPVSLPARRATAPPRRPWAKVWWVLAPLVIVVVVVTTIVGFQRFPYSVLSPGDATAGEPLVTIKGHATYKHKGAVLFVTVNVRDQVSGAEAVYGWLRGDQAVYPSHEVIGTHTPEEDLRSSLLDMLQSKEAAVVLALRHLGIDVPETDHGALVLDVSHGTPADGKVGIGDTIIAIGDQTVATVDDLRRILATHKPGDRITMSVRTFRQTTKLDAKPGAVRKVSLTLASFPAENGQPAQPNRAFVGITPMTNAKFELPFPVEIDTGQVGGPSAGLAFTLTLIDRLSPQGILGGKRVAVTGTIDLDGKVGPVGGVPQKTITVRRAGAKLFLVPSSEYAQAKAYAGSMRVEKVDTLDQALHILENFKG